MNIIKDKSFISILLKVFKKGIILVAIGAIIVASISMPVVGIGLLSIYYSYWFLLLLLPVVFIYIILLVTFKIWEINNKENNNE